MGPDGSDIILVCVVNMGSVSALTAVGGYSEAAWCRCSILYKNAGREPACTAKSLLKCLNPKLILS